MNKKNVAAIYIAGVLGLSAFLNGCGSNGKVDDLVRVPVESSIIWKVGSQVDGDGDRLISSDVDRNKFAYDLCRFNDAYDSRRLAAVAKKKGGCLDMPKENVNSAYDY